MNFYNKKLGEVKFTRDSVVVHKSNSEREKQINNAVLERKDSMRDQKLEDKEKRELN